MPKYAVRLESVEFAEIEVEASSALMARHSVMTMLDQFIATNGSDKADSFVGKAAWSDGGINVEGAREVANDGIGNANRS